MVNIVLDELIENVIYVIRGQKVMLSFDLAKLYAVDAKLLNRAVRRNIERFPDDFMFQLSVQEYANLKCQIGTSRWGGRRKLPLAFTEHGILMLSSVLNSPKAIQVNIQIMRTFAKLRKILSSHKEILKKIEAIENKYDHQFKTVFDVIKKILTPPEKPKYKIGFLRGGDKDV